LELVDEYFDEVLSIIEVEPDNFDT